MKDFPLNGKKKFRQRFTMIISVQIGYELYLKIACFQLILFFFCTKNIILTAILVLKNHLCDH